MSAPETRAVPADVIAAQREASDPGTSVFVSASAGSGKTHVLAQRVVRLLLDGTDPAKILCLTFTKAAAANMANRVFKRLADWTALDDEALGAEIAAIDGKPADPKRRLRARRLFAQALETPGGLKVQTIHAFCARLLQQFPFEARVAARFAVLDERTEEELIGGLRLQVLMEAAAEPESRLGQALAKSIAVAADQSFVEALNAAISTRHDLIHWFDHAGGLDAAVAQLGTALGLDVGDTEASIAAEIFADSLLAAPDLPGIIATLLGSSSNDRKQGLCLEQAQRAPDAERIDTYLSFFFTKDMTPRKELVTKSVAKAHPALAERLATEQARLVGLAERRRAVLARDSTAALLTIAEAILGRYMAEKNRRGLLDYDDLIDRTLHLLADEGAAWVHYKLDLGIDHVLIDEAQDTSPRQWDIVRRLVSEFTAGAGARGVKRTIFAVGDEKQSIYSFQGADPSAFAEMRQQFKRMHEAAERDFRPVQFKLSFRSGPNVLGAVNAVFRDPTLAASLTDDEIGMPEHQSLPDAAPGLVEIWDPVEPEDRPEVKAWERPYDAYDETSPKVVLARRIARTIRRWIVRGERTSAGAPVRPGDILVLVRQRGPLFNAVIRALKDAEIPVAGADRLVLAEHIAVMDLLVLADALLSPHDDLALATVLKSPLFGMSEEQLLQLAWARTGTLREALRASPDHAELAARLDRLALAARAETPFSFYSALLGAERGRHRMLARLGPEANDALDEFLALALDYESRASPSVQGFAAWMRAAASEIKRDMDIARDEVRVMTVHGAKGLEAPIVFVADTITRPSGPRSPLLLPIPALHSPPGTPDRMVWPGAKSRDCMVVAQARQTAEKKAEDEYRRLLYVAMTRAADRLVVCGALGKTAKPAGCWYDLVRDALAGEAETHQDEDGAVLRWRKIKDAAAGAATPDRERPPAPATPPSWLTQPVTAGGRRRPTHLAPSKATKHGARAAFSGGAARQFAMRRGRLIHRLMQCLPDVAPPEREAAARRYLDRAAGDLAQAERVSITSEVLAVLADAQFAPLFAPGSRAEAPIVGQLAGLPDPVSGQVDRLAVTAMHVLIADYKTDRPAPRGADEVPQDYLVQLALYRGVLRQLYPDRDVRTALVWTDGPRLMRIASSALEEALRRAQPGLP